MNSIIARAAESVHWYRQDGAPQYTVPAKDGSDRPTTLRDARKMDLVPSVTTVMKIAAKPGLEAWKLEQMLLAALTLPRLEGEVEKDFINRISADSKQTGKQAAERGTRVHESIERWYKCEIDVEHPEIAKAFQHDVSKHFGTPHNWQVEKSFASTLGYGGKIDLYCQSEMGIVLDAKSKEFAAEDKVVAYDEHLMQLAAYRMGLGLPNARCANVFASVTNPGLIKIVEWTQEELVKGFEMFKCLLEFWKLKNNFGK
jgi:hypothetical protein